MSGLAKEKSLEFSIDYETPVPQYLITDPTRLKQILLNLGSNAIKFTHQGHVRIALEYQDDSRHLYFHVRDTGVGIPKSSFETIFDTFSQADSSTTRKYGGTGLGLSISKQLAVLLGGDIRVCSELGKGSCFTLHIDAGEICDNAKIPVFEYQLPPLERAAGEHVNSLSGTILVAEDTPALQLLVERQLKSLGFEVDIASNGVEADEKACAGRYDLILIDMHMPEMDGLSAGRTLIAKHCEVPLVAMTADASKETIRRCEQAGFRGFLGKPVTHEELFSELKRHVGDRSNVGGGAINRNFMDNDPGAVELVQAFIGALPGFVEQANAQHKR